MPNAVLRRTTWNNLLASYGSFSGGSPFTPVGTNHILTQADEQTIRTWVLAEKPNHYFRTVLSPVWKMSVFNDLYDSRVTEHTEFLGNDLHQYILFSKVWQERTGPVYDTYDFVSAMQAIPNPPTGAFTFALDNLQRYTDVDKMALNDPTLHAPQSGEEWFTTRCYVREKLTVGGSITETITQQTLNSRIPTIVTAGDGSRTYTTSLLGNVKTIPTKASEPRSIYVALLLYSDDDL